MGRFLPRRHGKQGAARGARPWLSGYREGEGRREALGAEGEGTGTWGAAPQPPAMQGVPLTARTKDGEGVHLLTGKTQKLKGVCLVKKFLLSGRESLKQDPETPHECRATHDA